MRRGSGEEGRKRERERERERERDSESCSTCTHVLLHDLSCTCRCVIAELFMDGRPLFDLSQLLEYYQKEKEATEATLKKIPDRFIRVREGAHVVHCRL